MNRGLVYLAVGLLAGLLVWLLVSRLSADAIAMAFGLLFGVLAAIPTLLLVAVAQRRRGAYTARLLDDDDLAGWEDDARQPARLAGPQYHLHYHAPAVVRPPDGQLSIVTVMQPERPTRGGTYER